MKKLNLPTFAYKVKKIENKFYILDTFRKKYIRLTPEEWVRQHMVYYLVNKLAYPPSLMKLEAPAKYGELRKRADVLIYSRGQAKPLMLIECKATHQKISPKHLAQVAVYNTAFKAPFIVLTNGLQHVCFKIDIENRTHTQLKVIPFFKDLM